MASRNEFDKTIAETEAAYMKVSKVINKSSYLSLSWELFKESCLRPCTPFNHIFILPKAVYAHIGI